MRRTAKACCSRPAVSGRIGAFALRARRHSAVATALVLLCALDFAHAQSAVDAPRPEERAREQRQISQQQKKIAQASDRVEIVGATSFKDKELRDALKEQITSINELGLTSARGDDVAFFLELFYRKHGFAEVNVQYAIVGGGRLRLAVNEGARLTIRTVDFIGNATIDSGKLFDFLLGPTRERVSKAEKSVPYVERDLDEGVDLVRRVYVAEGFLHVIVEKPHVRHVSPTEVDVSIAIVEGRRYEFGEISFGGNTVVGPEKLRAEIADITAQPYTERRVSDIPRRLQAFFKARGHFEAKVEAAGNPDAARGAGVPVRITLSPGPVYYFDGTTVTGLTRLKPRVLLNRFDKLHGKRYSPDAVDERFREMMKTGLFNILQIKPVPIDDHTLHLEIAAEEAKQKQFGFSLGYGTYAGLIVGASYQDRNLFGYGRPITMSAEYSSRGYKGELQYEDPWLFGTDYHLKARLYALTFDFDGYSKFEPGLRFDLGRQFTKHYDAAAVLMFRHVEVTSADIPKPFLGRTSYQANSVGFTQHLDLRKNPLIDPRGFDFQNSFDYSSSALGSNVEFVRATLGASYYLQFSPEKKLVEVNPVTIEDEELSGFQKWFRRSSLAVGARVGVVKGSDDKVLLPIDERFFNGGGTTVRSFGERDLGPHVNGYPIGGEFYSIYNAEYTFPLYGELMGAIFFDAGNLLPNAEDAGFGDMRYAVGVGLRYKLPIGPLRLDYGVNPDPRSYEDRGAFHFSFGFAF